MNQHEVQSIVRFGRLDIDSIKVNKIVTDDLEKNTEMNFNESPDPTLLGLMLALD